MELKRGVFWIPKHPHFLEVDAHWPKMPLLAPWVLAGGLQKVLWKSIRDKFQRLGMNTCSKIVFRATNIAFESWDHQFLNPGLFDQITQADGE